VCSSDLELFGVTPDLATFGKGLANGYPLSVVAGSADIMAEFENVFFSFTMAGETLSLAAANATLSKLKKDDVVAKVREKGTHLLEKINTLIQKHRCAEFISTAGDPSWSFLILKEFAGASVWEIKTLWMQEILARGILSVGTHNLSYAHTDVDIAQLLSVYDEVFPLLRDAAKENKMAQLLRGELLKPLFKVR